MNGTKKTLTTLSAAAALALGGIAIAQTDASTNTQAGASLGSSSTMQSSDTPSSDTSTLSSDTSTLGAGSSDSSTLSDQSSSDLSNEPVAQMDRG